MRTMNVSSRKIVMELLLLLVFGSIQLIFASDHENKREELALYTSLFAFEIISTGLGTHLIRGKYFDIPARDQHMIAVAAVRTWWTLPYMKRVSDIIRKVSQSSADEYLKAAPQLSGRIYKYMFEKVELQLKLEPIINKIYDREKNNVSESGILPKLDSGIIEIEDSKNIDRKLQNAFTYDLNLRVVLINTIFQEYGFADVFREDRKDIHAMARAIVELSKRPKVTDHVSHLYQRAVHQIIADGGYQLCEQGGADLLKRTTLMRVISNVGFIASFWRVHELSSKFFHALEGQNALGTVTEFQCSTISVAGSSLQSYQTNFLQIHNCVVRIIIGRMFQEAYPHPHKCFQIIKEACRIHRQLEFGSRWFVFKQSRYRGACHLNDEV